MPRRRVLRDAARLPRRAEVVQARARNALTERTFGSFSPTSNLLDFIGDFFFPPPNSPLSLSVSLSLSLTLPTDDLSAASGKSAGCGSMQVGRAQIQADGWLSVCGCPQSRCDALLPVFHIICPEIS